MSKNDDLINIDQLFKSIKYGEEQEPAGSWDHMEGILDTKMPIGKAARKDYKRILASLLMLLIVGASVVYWQKHRFEKEDFQQQKQNKSINQQYAALDAANSVDQTIADINNNQNNKAENNIVASTEKTLYKNKHVKGLRNTKPTAGKPDPKSRKTIPSANSDQNKNSLAMASSSGGAMQQPHRKASLTLNSSNSKIIEEQKVVEVIKSNPKYKGQKVQATVAENTATTATSNWDPAATYKGQEIVSNETGTLYKKEQQQFQKYEILKRAKDKSNSTQKAGFLLDTLSIVKIQKIRYIPLSKIETYEVNKLLYASAYAGSVPAAASEQSNISVKLMPLSNYKVKSKKINTIDALKHTTSGISNYFDGTQDLFAALFLGANATIGQPNAYGMQFGLAGSYSFAERWTLSAELKFINKYFPGYNYQDQSHSYTVAEQQKENGWLYTGTESIVSNTYKVKSFYSLNLPVYVAYNLMERFSVFGGVNFSYISALNQIKSSTSELVDINQLVTNNEHPFHDVGFSINEKQDFKSRLGIGYVAGLNYDLSRKVSLDMRVTQVLWDNALGKVNALNKAFHKPSLEVSLGLYFGRRDKVIFIMDGGK